MKPKITFDIITLFPGTVRPYFGESVIGRAVRRGIIGARVHDLRKFTPGPYHKADDRPYGGGPGMVIKPEPLVKIIERLRVGRGVGAKTAMILLSASGKKFDDAEAARLARYGHIILVAGHYEGVDERVKKIFRLRELSVGPYVLTGGELPALTVIDAVSRKIKGVLGKEESLEEKRYGVGVPVYTRPEVLAYKKKKYLVPRVLLSGNHGAIERWRLEHRKK